MTHAAINDLLIATFAAVSNPRTTRERYLELLDPGFVQCVDGTSYALDAFLERQRRMHAALKSFVIAVDAVDIRASDASTVHRVNARKLDGTKIRLVVHASYAFANGLVRRSDESTRSTAGTDRDPGSLA